MSTRHEERNEAVNQVNQDFADVVGSGQWMSVLFYVEDGVVKIRRTTWQFPIGDFATTEKLLHENLDRELAKVQEPLPLAPFFIRDQKEVDDDEVDSVDGSVVKNLDEVAASSVAVGQ